MEIQGNDGSRIWVKPGSSIDFGRGHGFASTNRTVSRRHVIFQMDHRRHRRGEDEQPILRFEVVGRNPIWVHSQNTGKVETFRKFDSGTIENGDMFCVSAEYPIWFTVRKAEFGEEIQSETEKRKLGLENELAESLESCVEPEKVQQFSEIEDVDISNIDPVKEFGLVVIGHEFDGYLKKMIRDARKWEWFIEEDPGNDSDDDDEVEEKGRKKKHPRRKRKKGDEANDDEEWKGESEEEEEEQKEVLKRPRKVQKLVYSTRSKDRNKLSKERRNSKPSSGQRKSTRDIIEDEDEDEDDETLGGFIVDDALEEEDQVDDGGDDEDDDEEEEEFVEDDE